MGYLSNVSEMLRSAAEVNDRLPYVPAGDHLLEIIKVATPKFAGEAMIVEFEAEDGARYKAYFDLSGKCKDSRFAATAKSYQNARFFAFLAAAAGYPSKDEMVRVWGDKFDAWANSCFEANSPIVGRPVRCIAEQNGNYCSYSWLPVTE